jgi:predicted TPR repeat methyltransferase
MTKTIIIPTNPADVKMIRDAGREWSDSMNRIDAEKEQQKAVIEMIVEKTELPKSFVTRLFKDYHKDTFDKQFQENEDYQELFESIFRTNTKAVP